MRNRELVLGTILSYAQQIINALLGLLYTPFLLRSLGKGEYGLYSTVSSAIAMINLISLGLGHGYIRYYTKYKIEHNFDAKNRLNGLFLLIFLALGALALAVGLTLSNHLTWLFDTGLKESEYIIAKRLAIILTFNVAVSFPATVFSSIITAHEKFVVQKTILMIRSVLAPAITIPLLMLGYRSEAIVLTTFLVSVIADVCLIFYVLVFLKESFYFTKFERGLLKSLLIYTLPIAVNIIVDQINMNIDKLLLGRYKGTAEVAVYNIGYTMYVLYVTISTSISNVFTPRIHAIVNNNLDRKENLRNELTSLFTKVGRIQCELLLLVITGLVFFGFPFITVFWAGADYGDSYYVLLLLAIPATIPLIQNLGIEIQRAENLHKFRSIVYGVMAVLNLILSIYLCQKYGAVGSAVGTAVSFILCNGIIMNIFYHKKCSIDIISFWKSILRILVGVVPSVIIWLIIRKFFDLTSLPIFALGVVLYTAIYCTSMWFIGMNKNEKELVKGIAVSAKSRLS